LAEICFAIFCATFYPTFYSMLHKYYDDTLNGWPFFLGQEFKNRAGCGRTVTELWRVFGNLAVKTCGHPAKIFWWIPPWYIIVVWVFESATAVDAVVFLILTIYRNNSQFIKIRSRETFFDSISKFKIVFLMKGILFCAYSLHLVMTCFDSCNWINYAWIKLIMYFMVKIIG